MGRPKSGGLSVGPLSLTLFAMLLEVVAYAWEGAKLCFMQLLCFRQCILPRFEEIWA